MTGRWRFPQVNWRPRNATSSAGSTCSSRSFVRLPSSALQRSSSRRVRSCMGTRSCHGYAVVPMRRGDDADRAVSLANELGDAIVGSFRLVRERHWFIA